MFQRLDPSLLVNVYEHLYVSDFRDFKRMDALLDLHGVDTGDLGHFVVMRSSELVRVFGGSEALPRFQELQQRWPQLFTTLLEPVQWERVLFVSHRWETPLQPDPGAQQVRKVVQYVQRHPVLDWQVD